MLTNISNLTGKKVAFSDMFDSFALFSFVMLNVLTKLKPPLFCTKQIQKGQNIYLGLFQEIINSYLIAWKLNEIELLAIEKDFAVAQFGEVYCDLI